VLKQPFDMPIMTSDEIFKTILQFTRQMGPDYRHFTFQVDNTKLQSGIDDILPSGSDESFQNYAKRISTILKNKRFGISLGDFQTAMNMDCWNRFRYFLKSLYENAEMPVGLSELSLFAGNYLSTLRGVHLDDADVFCFVLEGKKRMRLWPRTFFEGRPLNTRIDHNGYKGYLEQSICLEGTAGDILYWPQSYWHVGECAGNFDVSLSLALHHTDTDLNQVVEKFRRQLEKSWKLNGDINRFTLDMSGLAARTTSMNEAFQMAGDLFDIETALVGKWMKNVTGYSFVSTPFPAAQITLKNHELLKADGAFPVLSRRMGDKLIIAFNGQVLTMAFNAKILSIIEILNSGEPLTAGEVIRYSTNKKEEAFPMNTAAVRKFLGSLLAHGALTKIG